MCLNPIGDSFLLCARSRLNERRPRFFCEGKRPCVITASSPKSLSQREARLGALGRIRLGGFPNLPGALKWDDCVHRISFGEEGKPDAGQRVAQDHAFWSEFVLPNPLRLLE